MADTGIDEADFIFCQAPRSRGAVTNPSVWRAALRLPGRARILQSRLYKSKQGFGWNPKLPSIDWLHLSL